MHDNLLVPRQVLFLASHFLLVIEIAPVIDKAGVCRLLYLLDGAQLLLAWGGSVAEV